MIQTLRYIYLSNHFIDSSTTSLKPVFAVACIKVLLCFMQVSEHLLSLYLDEYEETPWDALKYLVRPVSNHYTMRGEGQCCPPPHPTVMNIRYWKGVYGA